MLFRSNNENKYIEKIYLLNNEIFNLDFIKNNSKIKQILISNDPNYKLKYDDAINFINDKLKNKICILSNSDIYFDNSLSKIENNDLSNECFALLRYDEDIYQNKKIFTRHDIPRDDSQDSWIFRSPLNINIENINYSFGTLGCDSLFANEISESNIKLSNPSYDIITTHVHLTDFRTYNIDNRIHGKYCLLEPCKLNEYPNNKFMDY